MTALVQLGVERVAEAEGAARTGSRPCSCVGLSWPLVT
jgi:hypothetical protein